jgi:hypothetical protein
MHNLIPFPTEQLGPELEAVAHEIHQETGVAISTIATALLAVISLVVQGRIRIRKRPNLSSPAALWYMCVLPSGELKTSIAKRLMKGVQRFLDQQTATHAVQLQKYETEFRAWKAEGKGILSTIQRKSAASEPIEEEQANLQSHHQLHGRLNQFLSIENRDLIGRSTPSRRPQGSGKYHLG